MIFDGFCLFELIYMPLLTVAVGLFNAAPEVVEKPGDNSLSKLKSLYIQAKELSENEVTYGFLHLS